MFLIEDCMLGTWWLRVHRQSVNKCMAGVMSWHVRQVEEGVRKAMAAAAEAGIARDALLAREGALEAEVASLRQRQAAVDPELQAGSEARATAAGLQAALAAATSDAAGLRGQVLSVPALPPPLSDIS